MADFVKSAATRVPVNRSQAQIVETLQRYGATGFGFHTKADVVTVTFHVPGSDGREHTVAIPVDVARVRAKLKAAKVNRIANPEQAERVAWRIVLDWIDAALSAVSIGAQTIEEAFYAHTVVETVDGQRGRLVDYVNTITAWGDPQTGKLPHSGGEMFKRIGAGGA